MTTTTLRPAVRAAFAGLIDYAGLFPPAQLPMGGALAEYARARARRRRLDAGAVHRSRLACRRSGGLVGARGNAPLPVSLIADAAAEPRQWFDSIQAIASEIARLRATRTELQVEAIEVALAPLASARETFDAPIAQLSVLLDRAGLRDLPIYVEVPSDAHERGLLEGAMRALARARLRAKLRCGGIVAQAFPSPGAVADFVGAAARERVGFKATAGLHHPVRHVDAATGFVQHGFLNLLAAAAFAPRVAANVLSEIVAEEDPSAFSFSETTFAWREERASLEAIAATRADAFAGYGSCSFVEPVDDLTALGLISAAAPAKP